MLVHGHRGARACMPENTLPAFRYAIAAGADGIEMDLAVTQDNVIVISHDPLLSSPSQALIRELTRAELLELAPAIPTLDDVLPLAIPGSFVFNLEIKSYPENPEYAPAPAEFVRLLLARIRAYRLEERVLVQSFDFRTLIAMHHIAPEIPLSALTETDSRDFCEIAREAHAGMISAHFDLVSPAKVAAAHQAGIRVLAWTVNTPADWDRMIAANVDTIITDDPAQLLQYLGRPLDRKPA